MINQLQRDGIVIIPDVYSLEMISDLRNEYKKLWNTLSQNLPKLKKDSKGTYWFEDTEILDLAKGRFDFYWGMDKGIFACEKFLEPNPIKQLMKMELKSDYSHYAGALPSIGKSQNGKWHRDVYSLFNDEKLEISLPPFYFTILVPLVEITTENGPTEFIIGSHKLPKSKFKECGIKRGILKPGSVIVCNGMTYHRGTKNTTDTDRSMLYIIYHKNWYNDY
jgi:hypothetical protein